MCPAQLDCAMRTLRMRHHDRKASVRRCHRGDPVSRTVRIEGIALSRSSRRIQVASRKNRFLSIFRFKPLHATFTVRVDNRHRGTGHSIKEDGGALHDFDLHQTGFKLFTQIANEGRPMFGSGNNATQVTHHLAAVTDTQCKGIGTIKERREHIQHTAVAKNGFCPTATGTQYVTIRETTASGQPNKVFQIGASGNQIGHMNVIGFKAGTGKGCGHFSLAVDALLTQNRHLGTHTRCNERCCHILFWIKGRTNE